MPILIRGDDDVNLMFEMMEVRTQFTFYELYLYGAYNTTYDKRFTADTCGGMWSQQST